MASFADRIDRWIDALCADVRVFEDRALDARNFEPNYEEGPTGEVRRPLLRPNSGRAAE